MSSSDDERSSDSPSFRSVPEGKGTSDSKMNPSRKELAAVWDKLPAATKEICTRAEGILYRERYRELLRNNWPYQVKRRNLCHPRALALAGLTFHSLEPSPSVKCVVCLKILENLELNSNPWLLHAEASPDCYFVQLGQRDTEDDYAMDEMLEMVFKKIYNEARQKVEEREKILRKQLFTLRKQEKGSGAGAKDKN